METVLVTGGAGFIGRSVVRQLVERGYHVISLDNYVFSNQDQVTPCPNVEWITGDTRDYDLVCALLRESDKVMHLAAASSFLMHKNLPGDELRDLEACSLVMMGFKTLMEAILKTGHKKLVWASTSAVYEEWAKWPRVPFHEDLPLDPPDSKAGCKHWCELEARRYSNRHGIVSVAMRPFSVYGVGEHTKHGYANITSLFTWAMMQGYQPIVWRDGEQTRDFVYVDECAEAFILALEKDLPTTELNVGFGKDHSFLDTVKIVAEELGVSVPEILWVDPPIDIYAQRLLADMTRAKQLLGFNPRITLREGIRHIIRATKELPIELQVELGMDQHYFEKLPPEVMVPLEGAPTLR